MKATRSLGSLLIAICLASLSHAQTPPRALLAEAGYLGLHSGSAPFRIDCSTVAFTCDVDGLRVYAGTWRDRPFGVDVSALQLARPGGQVQGLKVSVFGKPIQDSGINVYGRLGTSMARAHTAVMGAGPSLGTGWSYGIGVAWEFSPGGEVRLGWDAYDVRLTGPERDAIRATSLGLSWRY